MFDIFGYMETAEEINRTAEGLKNEGDVDNLRKLAEENGIPVEIADMYFCEEVSVLTDNISAALGKIEVESAELKPVEIMADWVEYLKSRCFESVELSKAVRKKDKTLKGCIGALLKWSFDNMYAIDEDVKKAAGVTQKVKLGIPGMGRAKKIITEYYLGK